MKNRAYLVLFALAAASCTTKNENSALVITSVIPATATATTGSSNVSCSFSASQQEFTPALPINFTENAGIVGAVVKNNLLNTSTLNTLLRNDTTTFLPHQAVIDYEILGASATAPGQNIVPVSGIEVPGSGGTGTVGINIFNGLGGTLASLPNGAYIRTTFHLEGKLLDGTTVHTAEREYLFQVCTVTGCGLGSPWSATVGTPPAGGGALPECNGTNAPCIGTCF